MTVKITTTTTQADVERVIAEATRVGANCAQIKPAGKRGHVYGIEKVIRFLGVEAEIIFGARAVPGLPMKPLIPGGPDLVLSAPVLEPAPAPAAPPVIVPAKKGTKVTGEVLPPAPRSKFKAERPARPKSDKPRGSGFIAYIDSLLLDVGGKELVEGYVRSKHSVNEALGLVCSRFPDKIPVSVKKIIKVRPRHLERIKLGNLFDDSGKNNAPRWKFIGAGTGTGYMRRIDELLDAKKPEDRKTTRQIAVIVAKEFGKDMESALKCVRLRVGQFAKKNKREPDFNRQKPKKAKSKEASRAALIAKNKQLLAKKRK